MQKKMGMGMLFMLFVVLVLASCSSEHTTITVTQYTDPSIITGIAKYDGFVYCATQGGLVRWDIDAREYALITTAEGLLSNVLTDVQVDADSILWISSREGLTSFNGTTWTYYGISDGLPSTYITDLSADRNGTLWVSTSDGAAKWTGSRFNLLAEEGSPGRKAILSVYFDRGNNIWIGTETDGIYYQMEGEWIHRPQNAGKVTQNWDLVAWIYNDTSIGFWNGMSFSTYLSTDYLSTFGARYIDSTEDRLWFFTQNGVHSSYGSADWWHFSEKEGLASNDVLSGLVVSNDEVYVGTTNGLSLIKDGNIENYIVSNTPVGYNCIAIASDTSDRIWLGTWESGVSVFEQNNWSLFSGKENIRDYLRTVRSFIFGPDGEYVFNTAEGIVFLADDTWQVETRSTGVSGDDVRCGLFDTSGRYWAGTSTGICVIDNDEWTRYREYHGLPSEDTWACALGDDGTIWFGTTGGIVSFTGNEMENHTEYVGLDSLDVRSVCTVGSSIYFGTADGRLIVYNGTSWNVISSSTLQTDSAIYAITAEPSGVLWLGTDGDGIIRFDDTAVENYTVEDGIPYNVVRSLVYVDGKLWMACYGGAASLVRNSAP